jgi:hypothetical protein
LSWDFSADAATLPADWQHEQHFEVTTPGLVKFDLPPETLNAGRPGLEDLRLYDDAGNEVPYLIERPLPVGKIVQNARSFQVSLGTDKTVITLESGLVQSLDAVTLETPASAFIKSVRVEGRADGKDWQTLAEGQPIFRQAGGASQLRLSIPTGVWGSLRLTVDDRRSQPIPFTGALIHAAASEPVPNATMLVPVVARNENPGETRLTLNLGAANLDLAGIHIETSEPLFMRQVTLATPQLVEEVMREEPVAHGTIYRVEIEGQPASANLTVPVEKRVPSQELIMLIHNQDSPPLPVTAVRAERRPVYLVFRARGAGQHHLLTGNSRCTAPNYDLAAFGASLKRIAAVPIKLSTLADNPNFRAPEVLPGVQQEGVAVDVSAWKFRKPVKANRSGAQQLELDLDVLSHAEPGFDDLRLVRGDKQVAFVLSRTSIKRSLTPLVTSVNDPKDPKTSRWLLKLPRAGLPVTSLACVTGTPLFQREVALYEETTDARGEKYRRPLGGAAWVQTPDRAKREFVLALDSPPRGDALVLETHNGDNPAIQLDKFQFFYSVTRLVFKTQGEDEIFLFYGNPSASAPRYDLSLVAAQLLAADKPDASAGAEEQLKKASWRAGQKPGKGGVVFWGILALVVVVLLVIISKLLPKSPPPAGGAT